MKKIILIIGVLISILVPVSIHAYSGQYPWSPIYLEIEQTQESENNSTKQRLKSQYGVSDFYDCYPCMDRDTSNPYTETSCLQSTEYCLELKSIKQESECGSNEIDYGGKCMTIDEACKKRSGQNSYYRGVKDENGKYSCACKNGYEWNDDVTWCIKKQSSMCESDTIYVRSIDHLLADIEDAWPPCDCQIGYQWENNQCVKKQITTCTEGYYLENGECINVNIEFDEDIFCSNGYVLSLNKKSCIKVPNNAHIVNSATDVWGCNEGYGEVDYQCVKEEVGEVGEEVSDVVELGVEIIENNTESKIVLEEKLDDVIDVKQELRVEREGSAEVVTKIKSVIKSTTSVVTRFFRKLKFW